MSASKNLPIVDWLQINSSAPGKFIVSGEYAVVYEKQAIAAAVDLRTKVTIRPNKDGLVRLSVKNLESTREWPTSALTSYRLISKYSDCLDYNESMPGKLADLLNAKYCVNRSDNKATGGDETISSKPNSVAESTSRVDSEAAADQNKAQQSGETNKTSSSTGKQQDKDLAKKTDDAVMAFLLLYIGLGDSYSSSARPPIDVEIESSIPVGSGLGSSSAYSVSLCGALMRVFRVAAEKYIISNWAFNIDKFFHGSPSGVDNNIVSVGGYILFQNGKIKAHGVPHKSPIKVMLINTGVSRSTKALSETVAASLRKDESSVMECFHSINEMTTQIWRMLNHPDFSPRDIAAYLEANHTLLNTLGVGHAKLSDICQRAQLFRLTAKLCGAGGGGFAFVLYNDSDSCENIKQLRENLVSGGYAVYDLPFGCEGLRVSIVPDPNKKFGTSHG